MLESILWREHAEQMHQQLGHAEVVSGRWLVKAILVVLALAGVALYFTICLLFYQGQWQFTFFPPNTAQPSVATVAASSGLPITDVRFDTTEEGIQRLDGWWIPSPSSATAPLSDFVILFCPDGHTDLPDNVEALEAFHSLGVNVFAFDYQGFGNSQAGHPSQQKAYANGIAARNYVTGLRHIPADHIVLYGYSPWRRRRRACCTTFAQHCRPHPRRSAAFTHPGGQTRTAHSPAAHVAGLSGSVRCFRDLPLLKMPKLILSTPAMSTYASGVSQVYKDASAPKQQAAITESNRPVYSQPEWRAAVGNFLNSVTNRLSDQARPVRTLK